MANNTPSKAQIKVERILGKILPGADGDFYDKAADRHEAYREADKAKKNR